LEDLKMKKRLKLLPAILSIILAVSVAACSKKGGNTGGAADTLNWPSRAITIVVPASPGGGTDVSARLAAKYMEPILGKSIVIQNITGGTGSIGAAQVRQSNDDHTFFYFHNAILIAKVIDAVDFLSYEVMDPIASGVQDFSNSLFVRADSDIKDIPDLVQKIRNNPGTITFAIETGGNTHLSALAFQEAAGGAINLLDVGPDAEKIAAVMGGFADVTYNYYGTAAQYVESGDFRCLGLVSPEPNPLMPGVKTAREQGVDFAWPGFIFTYYAKQGTNPAIINKFSDALKQAVNDPALQAELKNLSYIAEYHDTEETKKILVDMYEDFAKYQSLIGRK
jgi:tripartite-type tricarboxylate transporter receptor subunit TctC